MPLKEVDLDDNIQKSVFYGHVKRCPYERCLYQEEGMGRKVVISSKDKIFNWPSAKVWEGQFKDGQMNGFGRLI